MKRQANTADAPGKTIRCIDRRFVAVAVAVSWTALGQIAPAADSDYFRNALLNPSETVLLAEHRGRVTIFDGLDNHVVDRALDSQFERIDRMMFVRTRHVQQDGSVESDDDCD